MRTTLCRAALLASLTLGCNEMATPPDGDQTEPTFANVRSVTIQPGRVTLDPGGTVQLTASARPRKFRSFAWASSNRAVATVSASGLVTAVAAGTATITATTNGVSGSATVTVRSGAVPVASVTVTPNPASVPAGGTVQLTATPRDADGNPLSGRQITWTTNAASIATVNASGLVTGVTAGSATITATSEGRSGASAVTVTASGGSQVLLAAGDIASCSSSGDAATATLLDGLAGTVVTLGDNAYPDGTAADFANCYAPTWGRHKARTRPSPGNHDYHTSGATGYYNYFGTSAGPSGRGYYSYDLGDWHIVSLNSNVSMSAGSAQEQWLRADLAANTRRCTLAYWHHPRFSSGTAHGNFSGAQPIWQALYDFDADVALAGHEHNYERFAPQTPTGTADPTGGIREFVVGTGGVGHYSGHSAIPNSEVFDGSTFGVLKLTLSATSYTWQFIPVAGQSFTDRGSGTCH